MHRLHHRKMARALKLSSFFYLLTYLARGSFLLTLAYLYLIQDNRAFIPLGIIVLVALVTWLLSISYGTNANCQLCQTTLTIPRKCTKHRQAKALLGSYRLKLSLDVLLKNSFVCPFCGERFSTKVEEIPRGTHLEDPANTGRTSSYRPISTISGNRKMPQKRR